MSRDTAPTSVAERLGLLHHTSPATDMGRLLRRFWHPVALSRELRPGKAKACRLLGETMTLYRGESGRPYLVAGHCPHRRTLLHTGWVQGEDIRCIYHGWKFDGAGQCREAPAEGAETAAKIRVPAWPVHEYAGMIFAWPGEGEAPEFSLLRKDVFERPNGLMFARAETWRCNWFQLVENSMDAVHVSFVHRAGLVGNFGAAVSGALPRLEYLETDAGIRQIATRGPGNVRVSDWTFPNCNHIVVPGVGPGDPWIDVGHWNVPNDDETTTRMMIYSIPSTTPEADARITAYFEEFGDYNPADHHDDLFDRGIYPRDVLLQLTSAQDYVAALGQDAIADRSRERLGKSDAGIVLLRRLCWREMDAIREGRPAKQWTRLPNSAELPTQNAALAG